MEGFLSLPRSAKGGLAVLLAVALLGWGIVAYSAKRQHEDARRLDNAIATLKSQKEREATAVAELASLNDRFAAAEAELSSNRDAMVASREVKSTPSKPGSPSSKPRFRSWAAEAEGTCRSRRRSRPSRQRRPAMTIRAVAAGAGGGQPSLADAETLRSRLDRNHEETQRQKRHARAAGTAAGASRGRA